MLQFHIQPDSEIPASTQLFNQLRFAIASRQFPPGHKLPSTRALAMQTGLHRNTIGKVYRQLEDLGLVEAQAGSGIYVRSQTPDSSRKLSSPIFQKYPEAYKIVQRSLDELLQQGCSLNQAREFFLTEIDWRLRCSARVLVTAPIQDIGAGQLMAQELEQALGIPVQLVPLEELAGVLEKAPSGTIVTSRYFIAQAEAIAAPKSVRVLPIDIYDYGKEIEVVKSLPQNSCLGLVGLSAGILRVAEVISHSLRGEEILVMAAQREDDYKVNAIVRTANTIVCDPPSVEKVKTAIAMAREELIRPPRVIPSENYIHADSIDLLKRELGLD
ncbi:GntR family transcriptional regulator [Oxynema aestuarii]|jgi:GntR family transcriptional regulator|uniref:GntR family transcriptional regulator n=1 Tax=Oxynema aestuarii AP17 TaxID=2064643 RepID=A0A6H1U0V4_9CYAN|nr:GntR family transcriptional regulator [Oxynema aestuarii]QIZ71249.1 GntR family transcriptional regulator [Oxynema aestuarii AP17]RMH75033.1 MAG: GntR family transcriptional regulator [Cyanobacteria bacterium J007]